MKKFLYPVVLIAILVFKTDVWAQTSVTATLVLPMDIQKTKIREYNFPSSISYVESTKGNYFVYADTTLSAIYVPVDTNYIINDYVVDRDSVFFCGRNKAGFGIVGFFDINDYFFGLGNYYVVNTVLYSEGGTIANLTNVVSYYTSSDRHIVAIGTTQQSQYCIMDLVNEWSSGVWIYETGEVPTTSPETMVELTSTDGFLVTSGMYTNDSYNPSLVFRVYAKNDVFSTSYPLQDVANVFSDASLQHSFCLDQIVTRQVGCNAIVAAAFWKYYTDTTFWHYEQLPQGTYIGKYTIVFDPKDVLVHNYSVLCSHSYYYGKWNLYGFSNYNISNMSFNLLQEYETSSAGDPRSFVYELSDAVLQNASSFHYATTDVYRFFGISGNSVIPYYIMNGRPWFQNTNMVYNMGAQDGNICLDGDAIQPDAIQLNRDEYNTPLSVIPGDTTYFKCYNSKNETEQIIINCEE